MRISVVTPTLALDAFLAEARASVARQVTPVAIQHLIVVDDSATPLPPDESRGNVETRFLHNAEAKGPGGARNTALDQADGSVVFFLDADDIWADDHVDRMLAVYAREPGVGAVSAGGVTFGEQVTVPRLTIPELPGGVLSRAVVAWNPIGGPSGFSFRRTRLTRDIRFRDSDYFQDILFYWDLLVRGVTFWREADLLFWYRRSPGQLISIMPVDRIRASEALVHRCIAGWRGRGLSPREATIATIQIRRLTANRLRRRDYGNSALLALLAPEWAIAQIRRAMANRRLARTRAAGLQVRTPAGVNS